MSKLDTSNLSLRVRVLADVDALVKIHPTSATDRDAVVKSVFLSDTHWRKNGFGFWSIFLKSELIGAIGLKRSIENRVLFEIVIDPKHRKMGYAKEASKAVLDFGFRLHKIAEISASVQSLNTPALSLLKTLGFTELASTPNEMTLTLKNPTKQ